MQTREGSGGGGPKNTDQDANQGGYRWRRVLEIPFQAKEDHADLLPENAPVQGIRGFGIEVLKEKSQVNVVDYVIAQARADKKSFQLREIHARKAGCEKGSDRVGAGNKYRMIGECELFDRQGTGIIIQESEGRAERIAGIEVLSLQHQ